MVLSVDKPAPKEAIDELTKLPDIHHVKEISF